jgi:hypothetical protein
MKSDPKKSTIRFLGEGGEMARLIQQFDWANSQIGPINQWPGSLNTILGLMMHSKLPMFLWWGEDRLQFYNDAILPCLTSQDKHPAALGQPGDVCWGDQWPMLSLHVTQVMAQGKVNTIDPELRLIFPGCKIENEYWTADYNSVYNEAGQAVGVLAICQVIASASGRFPNNLNWGKLAAGPPQVGVWEMDLITRQIQLDARSKELYGIDSDQVVTHEQILSLIHPDDLARLTRITQWSLTAHSGEPLEFTYRVIGANDGQLRWLHAKSKTFFNDLGELTSLKGTIRQVSWELEANSQLEKIEQRFQSLLDGAPVAVFVMRGPKFVTELINQQMCIFCGRTQEQMLGKPVFDVLVELAGQGFDELLLGVLQTGVPYVGNELPITLQRYGALQTLYINISFVPLREVDDLITGITAVVMEVTEQVAARHRVEASAAYLQRLFQLTTTAIGIVRGPKFVVELANPIICALWGRTEDQLLGIPLFEAMPEVQGQGFEELLADVLQTRKPFIGNELPVTLYRNEKLETIYVEFTYEPFPDVNGQVDRIIITAIDATKRVQIRQQVEQLLIQERELNQLKSNFVSMASHEFRTPMATILSSASLISDYDSASDGDNRLRHVQRIQSAVHRLTRILDDFLVITQLEQKKRADKVQNLVLSHFCNEVIEVMEDFIKPGQHIHCQHQNETQTITIDGDMVKNILINLLSNASKYSPEGADILLTTAVHSNQLVLSVKDWGIGIPELDQDKLFTNFFRARNARHLPGTGLGLYIVKRSVDLLGGTIAFESRLKSGTTFTIQLPLTPQAA